jgi:hypothetical protein
MRYLFIVVLVCLLFVSCNKGNGNSAPEIKYKSITSTVVKSTDPNLDATLTINITDADGDLGFNEGKDTSYIYVKRLNPTVKIDSFKFPTSLANLPKNNFTADVDVSIINLMPGTSTRRRDTLYFEVYAKDFAKNKSNVIKTEDALVYISP